MKKTINGLRYDTEKAILIGEADNIHAGASSISDFNYWDAGLYKTKRAGRFFLAGTGGPMTRFSHSVDQNSWSGGSKIIPMTEAEALKWAEQYLGSEIIEEHFGDIIEDA